uniref:MFS domain-containing protein n=1 Tax=Panagrellus redivivus TaxID=6233 RepID=A0A7E4UQ41_PANRE
MRVPSRFRDNSRFRSVRIKERLGSDALRAQPTPEALRKQSFEKHMTTFDSVEKSCFDVGLGHQHLLRMATVHPVPEAGLKKPTSTSAASLEAVAETAEAPVSAYPWMPSFRFLTAALLCTCFASVHMMNSNMGMAIVCMVNSTEFSDDAPAPRHHRSIDNDTSEATDFLSELEAFEKRSFFASEPAAKVNWSPTDQGYIFGAFNAGLLCMLATGLLADKFNAKYMIIASVLTASTANFIIPLLSPRSVYFAIFARFLIGLADSLLQPAINSLLTRWFPANERSYALGVASGGRQIGALLIVPTAGALCSQTTFFGGWPSIFYVSAFAGIFFVSIYAVVGTDKPSKQSCISEAELRFITTSNASENLGQKRTDRRVPWYHILRSGPVWAALTSVVCHEFPLMTMIMFLPSYLHDVHKYKPSENGILSALPTLCLWISKIGSSYLNTWLQKRTHYTKTFLSKFLNGVGSAGMGAFLVAATFLDASHAWLAVVFLCLSMLFTGMHTPGCQAALVAIAPAFSGAITGLTFFFVAICGITNPLLTKWIVQKGTYLEWNLVFYLSAFISVIPVITFTLFGSADVQWWAKSPEAYTEAQAAKAAKSAARVQAKKSDKDNTSNDGDASSLESGPSPQTSIENIESIA